MNNWVYHGAVAFTKESPAAPEVFKDIEKALEAHGFQTEQFCDAKYTGCTNLRKESQNIV